MDQEPTEPQTDTPPQTQVNIPPQSNTPKKMHGPHPLLGLILAVLIPPLGLIISIWALIKVIKNHQKGDVFAIIGIAVGVLLTAVLLFIYSVLNQISGGGHSNQAQEAMKPIEAKIKLLGGQRLCVNGDNGYTLDNREPWYSAYYSVSSDNNLTQQIKDAVSQSGYYQLQTDNATIDSLKAGNGLGYPNVDTYSANNDYIKGTNQATKSDITLEVIRSGQIALDCNTGTYGEAKSPKPNGAIVFLTISFPSTQ